MHLLLLYTYHAIFRFFLNIDYFLLKLGECENRQRELQSIRLALEKEISVKKTSISIDRDRCLR